MLFAFAFARNTLTHFVILQTLVEKSGGQAYDTFLLNSSRCETCGTIGSTIILVKPVRVSRLTAPGGTLHAQVSVDH
jgi:hypothetical protein